MTGANARRKILLWLLLYPQNIRRKINLRRTFPFLLEEPKHLIAAQHLQNLAVAMNECLDENESASEDSNEQPASSAAAVAESSSADTLAPESESGEILQLQSYPENVMDQPESVKMLTVATQSKSKMEKYKKDFVNTVCCLVSL